MVKRWDNTSHPEGRGIWNTRVFGGVMSWPDPVSLRGASNEPAIRRQAIGRARRSAGTADRLWRNDWNWYRVQRRLEDRKVGLGWRRDFGPGSSGQEGREAQHHRRPTGLGELRCDHRRLQGQIRAI